MPEHWEVVRNGRLFVQRNEIGFPDLPILEVSLRTGVGVRDFENPDRKQMMSVRGQYKRAVKGDIAYNMMRMWQGAVGIAPVDGLVSPAYVIAKPLRGTEPRYFSALFRTNAYMTEVDKCSRGIVKDRNRLYWEDFKQIPTPCPPPDEQVLIADGIDQSVASIDSAIARASCQIELVQEYRTRLIADVVTGKLDVREAAAQLPDEAGHHGPLEEGSPILDGLDARNLRRRGGENMIDWSKCPGVEQIPGKVSGAWLFTDSRLPVSALFENLEAGATVEEFMEWFGARERMEGESRSATCGRLSEGPRASEQP